MLRLERTAYQGFNVQDTHPAAAIAPEGMCPYNTFTPCSDCPWEAVPSNCRAQLISPAPLRGWQVGVLSLPHYRVPFPSVSSLLLSSFRFSLRVFKSISLDLWVFTHSECFSGSQPLLCLTLKVSIVWPPASPQPTVPGGECLLAAPAPLHPTSRVLTHLLPGSFPKGGGFETEAQAQSVASGVPVSRSLHRAS